MPRTSTFLRFTTRGLLLVMLGLSVVLAIAFSLLPPLLGITRIALAVGLGLYLVVFGFHTISIFVWQHTVHRNSGNCLFRYPNSSPRTWIGVGCLLFLGSGILFVAGCRQAVVGETAEIPLMLSAVAGLMGSAGCNFLLRRRSMESVEFCDHGIVAPDHGLVPWFKVSVGRTNSPDVIELWLRTKRLRLELSETEREAVEAILTKHKPHYARLDHAQQAPLALSPHPGENTP